jgi:hypothetical protein
LDPRIVTPEMIAFLRACGEASPAHLGGDLALAAVHLRHRQCGHAELFVHDRGAHRTLVGALPGIGAASGVSLVIRRDAKTHVRLEVQTDTAGLELDVVFEPNADLEPPAMVDGILVESLTDLRVNKLGCIFSRSEPRDLVDLLFLERAGHPPDADVPLAVQKDAEVDPTIMAWLVAQLPLAPLPAMLVPVDEEELRRFRGELYERFKRLATPGGGARR